jgi:hypothetical protein
MKTALLALLLAGCGQGPDCSLPPSLSCTIQQTDGQWYRVQVTQGPQVNVVKLVKCDCGGAP